VEGQPVSGSYDPQDFPILAELEQEFARMVASELNHRRAGAPGGRGVPTGQSSRAALERDARPAVPDAPAPAPAPRPRSRRPRARPSLSAGGRILGRAVAAGALAGVVGATALATKSVVSHTASDRPVVLQRASDHQLVLRPYQGRLCLDVTYEGGVASRCVDRSDRGDAIAPLSAAAPHGRIVVGLVGSDVARVVVSSAGRRAEVATQPAGKDGLRWFAVVLPSVRREAAHAATIAPRTANGQPAGPVEADCTLGTAASCTTAHEHKDV
jgi:hypothetical protein